MGRMEIITGRERRRRWPDEEKLRILEEAAEPGISAAAVARRHDLLPQQIYTWRRRFRVPSWSSDPAPSFLPLAVVDGTPPASCDTSPATGRKARPPGRIEIVCRNGRVVKVGAGFDIERLGALIRAVETA